MDNIVPVGKDEKIKEQILLALIKGMWKIHSEFSELEVNMDDFCPAINIKFEGSHVSYLTLNDLYFSNKCEFLKCLGFDYSIASRLMPLSDRERIDFVTEHMNKRLDNEELTVEKSIEILASATVILMNHLIEDKVDKPAERDKKAKELLLYIKNLSN